MGLWVQDRTIPKDTLLKDFMANAEDCEGEIIAFRILRGSEANEYYDIASIQAWITGLVIPEGSKVRRLSDPQYFVDLEGWKVAGDEKGSDKDL